jgi:hypothetical protein
VVTALVSIVQVAPEAETVISPLSPSVSPVIPVTAMVSTPATLSSSETLAPADKARKVTQATRPLETVSVLIVWLAMPSPQGIVASIPPAAVNRPSKLDSPRTPPLLVRT